MKKSLILCKKITKRDSSYIRRTILDTDLSYYKMKQKDFYAYKDSDWSIVAFGRIYEIWNGELELSSIWVDPDYRWKKLWLSLSQELIKDKKLDNNLYLATKSGLGPYYQQLWFEIIKKDIPKKLQYTLIRAKENNIDAIIMKYKK